MRMYESNIAILYSMIKRMDARSLHNSFMMLSFVLEYAKEHEEYESCSKIQKAMNEIQKQIIEYE